MSGERKLRDFQRMDLARDQPQQQDDPDRGERAADDEPAPLCAPAGEHLGFGQRGLDVERHFGDRADARHDRGGVDDVRTIVFRAFRRSRQMRRQIRLRADRIGGAGISQQHHPVRAHDRHGAARGQGDLVEGVEIAEQQLDRDDAGEIAPGVRGSDARGKPTRRRCRPPGTARSRRLRRPRRRRNDQSSLRWRRRRPARGRCGRCWRSARWRRPAATPRSRSGVWRPR